jgi:Fe-S cluster assembly scaffold protein SufB
MQMEISESFVSNISEMFNEPAWLKEFRLKSLDYFKSLPFEQSQLFIKYTNEEYLNDLESRKFDYRLILMEESDSGLNFENCIVTTSEGIENKVKFYDRAFVFSDIFSAIKSRPQIKELILSAKIDDKIEALNNSLFNSGVFIYVPFNTKITIPLRSIFLINKDKSAIFNKTIIFVDENSSVDFIEEVYSHNSKDCFYSENLEIFVKGNSEANITFLQNTDFETKNFVNRKIFSNGKVSLLSSNIGGNFTRYRIEGFLSQPGAAFENYDMFFGNSEQKLDTFSRSVHISPNTTSRVISRVILKDKAEALIKGIIKILKEAKNAQAYLEEHSIMLNKECKANSIPSLEIETFDVKATHSASTQQLDAEQMFYLMSRGLTEEEAKKMIAFGFLEPVLKCFLSNSFRRCVEAMIENKWIDNEGKLMISDLSDYRGIEKESTDIFGGHYKYR